MKKLICVFISGVLLMIGCDSLLEVDTVSDITSDSYWQSPGDMESYLHGIYAGFRNNFRTGDNSFATHFEDRSDAFVPITGTGLSEAWHQNLTPEIGPIWDGYYNIINHCNLMLKYSEGIDFRVQDEKDKILGETYFIRAYMYFSLIRLWGDVPLELEPTEADDKPQLPRASAEEVMTQVLKDIEAAIDLFPEDGYDSKNRASKPSAYALKADALLWKFKVLEGTNQDLEEAIEGAEYASMGLSLENDFSQIFSTDNRNGKEIIFSIHLDRDEFNEHYSSRLKPTENHLQDAINKDDIAYGRQGKNGYAPSPKLEALFDENPDDQRKDQTMIKAIAADGSVIAVYGNKFRGTQYGEERIFDNDIIVYRFAEMILFKAEALAGLGRVNEAVAELNKVRNRAGIGNYSGPMDQKSVEEAILDERFRELFLELKRWPDLLRFHFSDVIDVYEEVPNLEGKSIPLFFPIPREEIALNPNLEQTEGY